MNGRRWLTRLVAVVLLMVAVPLAAPGRAWACSCSTAPLEESVVRADAVFVGTVAALDPVGYKVAVSGWFKGDPGAEVLVVSPGSQASCGLEARVGDRYLFVARGSSAGLSVGLCGGTVQTTPEVLAQVAAVLGEIRPVAAAGTPAAPVIAPVQPTATPVSREGGAVAAEAVSDAGPITLAVVASLVAAVLAAAGWHRPRRSPPST